MIQTILAVLNLPLLVISAADMPPELRSAYRLLLLTAGTLLGVFVLTILLLRSLRRYRQTFLGKPRKPTPNDDLWSQYRLPKELEEDKPSDQSPDSK